MFQESEGSQGDPIKDLMYQTINDISWTLIFKEVRALDKINVQIRFRLLAAMSKAGMWSEEKDRTTCLEDSKSKGGRFI